MKQQWTESARTWIKMIYVLGILFFHWLFLFFLEDFLKDTIFVVNDELVKNNFR